MEERRAPKRSFDSRSSMREDPYYDNKRQAMNDRFDNSGNFRGSDNRYSITQKYIHDEP